MKTITSSEEKKLDFGPIWILQLWLSATFESSLNVYAPIDLARRVKGTRLVFLTLEDVDLSIEEDFRKYLFIYVDCGTFVSSMTPFVNRSHVSYWCRREFPASSLELYYKSLGIWVAFLKLIVLLTRILTGKSTLGVMSYQPNFVARQFCFCQFLPRSLFIHKEEICLANTILSERDYRTCLYFHTQKVINLTPFEFQDS